LESHAVDLADGRTALTIADPAGLDMKAAKGCSAPLPFGEDANRLSFAVRDRSLFREASERKGVLRIGQILGERIGFQKHAFRHVAQPTVHWPTEYVCFNSGGSQMRRK
jgi:hypothetical protein